MPAYDNTLVAYEGGKFIYEIPEFVMDHLLAIDQAPDSPRTESPTSFIMDWRVDNDTRLVTEWIECQSVTMMDRTNDVYLNDVTRVTVPGDVVNKDILFGWDVASKAVRARNGRFASDKQVTCWYCHESVATFSFREFSRLCPQGYDNGFDGGERLERAFCYAMLEHFQAHRDVNDLPYVTTLFPGKTIYRPDGSVAAVKPDVTRRWKINGNLLGPSQKWFDPTQREFGVGISIASTKAFEEAYEYASADVTVAMV